MSRSQTGKICVSAAQFLVYGHSARRVASGNLDKVPKTNTKKPANWLRGTYLRFILCAFKQSISGVEVTIRKKKKKGSGSNCEAQNPWHREHLGGDLQTTREDTFVCPSILPVFIPWFWLFCAGEGGGCMGRCGPILQKENWHPGSRPLQRAREKGYFAGLGLYRNLGITIPPHPPQKKKNGE